MRDDDVIRRNSQDERGEQCNAAGEELLPQQVDQGDRSQSQHDHEQPGCNVTDPEVEDHREQELHQQWMGAKNREELRVGGVPGECGSLTGIYGLVAVESDRTDGPHTHDEAD